MENISEHSAISSLENSRTPYVCTICSPFCGCVPDDFSLELHCLSKHPVSTSIVCIYCLESVSVSSIKNHIDRHLSYVSCLPYVCYYCPMAFYTMKALAQHSIHIHNIVIDHIFYKCFHCNEAMQSPSQLAKHLSESQMSLYHCGYPDCLVKSRSSALLAQHSLQCHGTLECVQNTIEYCCSWPLSQQPSRLKIHNSSLVRQSEGNILICRHCCFGTFHLDNFAQHLATCGNQDPGNVLASLSVNCTLYRCTQCNWTTTIRNILAEHVQERHSGVSLAEGIVSEDFTVPRSEDSLNCLEPPPLSYSEGLTADSVAALSAITHFTELTNKLFSCSSTVAMAGDAASAAAPILSFAPGVQMTSSDSMVSTTLTSRNDSSRLDLSNGDGVYEFPEGSKSLDICDMEEGIGTGAEAEDLTRCLTHLKQASDDNFLGFCQQRKQKVGNVDEPSAGSANAASTTSEEYIQLHFNELAFVAAYMRSNKVGALNRAAHRAELQSTIDKLNQFAKYRVPILGRANQRRVAGCPVCLKPFNHGFTDLKKHLLVTHLGVRRDICRFTLDFTHPTKVITSCNSGSGLCVPGEELKQATLQHKPQASKISSLKRHHLSGIASHRFSSKLSQKKSSFSHLSSRKSTLPKHNAPSHRSPIAAEECDLLLETDRLSNQVRSSDSSSYSGAAPVHRVVPGTGVSDQYEDMRSLDEVMLDAPPGRGGIVYLDKLGNPVSEAVAAASQPHSAAGGSGTEMYLPKLGRQHIQLAYSLPVFKRLLESYHVPVQERIQLINRMNHYARMYVLMDVLVPGGAQKRFTCPTCMYTSVHSLADIRKHIMGSHCGISTKRFRLCLRASRHDTTAYRLHSDERMIRFVEDHRRRQIELSHGKSSRRTSAGEAKEGSSKLAVGLSSMSEQNDPAGSCDSLARHPLSEDGLESMDFDHYDEEYDEKEDGDADQYQHNGSYYYQTAEAIEEDDDLESKQPECLNLKATAAGANAVKPVDSEDTLADKEENHCQIHLPFSTSVLRTLLQREGMQDQFADLLERMEIYSSYYLTVISRSNRIHAYVCRCGRKFAVIRNDEEIDIRPASLADCRRHILGVHARIPQELLTLCCQASRISKESGYQLYSDTSLLALAEQHKSRTNRIQTYTRFGRLGATGDSLSPYTAKAHESLDEEEADEDEDRDEEDGDRLVISADGSPPPIAPSLSSKLSQPATTVQWHRSGLAFTTNSPSQVVMRHSALSAYSTNRSLPPMQRAPKVRHEDLSPAAANTPTTTTTIQPKHDTGEKLCKKTAVVAVNKLEETLDSASDSPHNGLDLEAPQRALTSDEVVHWTTRLGLPNNWILERIVRLAYNPTVFEHKIKMLLPENDNFIDTLHDRMRVFTRHSVYIAHLRRTSSSSQRMYICCACFTTSQHGFGDVRKHILGVHAHVPERFKSAAMTASRLNREDYTLYPEEQLLHMACTPSRTGQASGQEVKSSQAKQTVCSDAVVNTGGGGGGGDCDGNSRVLRRRQPSNDHNMNLRNQTSPSRKRSRPDFYSPPGDRHCIEDVNMSNNSQSYLLESMTSPHVNGHSSLASKVGISPDHLLNSGLDHHHQPLNRPPIILTLPRQKILPHLCDSTPPEGFASSDSSPCETGKLSLAVDELSDLDGTVQHSSASESRSRRSMVLKSKRPCPAN